MRVCVIVPSFYPAYYYGGSIFSIHDSLSAISRSNFKIYVSTTSANGTKRLDVEKNKFLKIKKNYFVKYYFDEIINRFSFSFFLGIWKDVKKSNLVYIQDIFSIFAILGIFASVFYKKKCLIAPRGSLSKYSLRSKFYFLKILWVTIFFKPFNKHLYWHVTSSFEKKDIIQQNFSGKIYIIPNFLNINLRKIKKLKKYSWMRQEDKKKIRIGTLSRIDKKKGFDKLILSLIKELKLGKIILSICGNDHGYLEELKKIVSKHKIDKGVYFLKPLYGYKKYQYLKSLDLFCLISEHENFGNVYLEALASGTPILASTNTPWQLVKKYKCGDIVETKITSINRKIKFMLRNKNKFLKKNCYKLSKKFSIQNAKKFYSIMFNELKR